MCDHFYYLKRKPVDADKYVKNWQKSGEVWGLSNEPSTSIQGGKLSSIWSAVSFLKTIPLYGVTGNQTAQYSEAKPLPEVRSSSLFLNLGF